MTQEGTHLSCCGNTLKGPNQGAARETLLAIARPTAPPSLPSPRDPKFSGFPKPPMLGHLQEEEANSLTADNLEKFGKLSAAPGPPDDGTLLSEAKLQSIMSFLDEMEKSGQEQPAPWREVVSSQVSSRLPVGSDRAALSYPGIFSR